MARYKVKLTFKYSDIIHVEADNEPEAISRALLECEEEYESFYDAKVENESLDSN